MKSPKRKKYKNNPEVQKRYQPKYHSENPWVKYFQNASSRCTRKNGPYVKKGIKCFLTVAIVKTLWFRDQAWLLKEPSIDRIDNDKHYTLNNCRFIERKDNSMQGFMNGMGKKWYGENK